MELKGFEVSSSTINTGKSIPLSVAVSKSGMVMFREQIGINQTITVINNAVHSMLFQKNSFEIECRGSGGVAFTNEDHILVTDDRQVLEFTLEGIQIKSIRQHGQLQFQSSQGIMVHPFSRQVFIADTGNHRIQILNNDLTYSKVIGIWQGKQDGQFNMPIDIACDSHGNVYITDCMNNCMQVFTHDGDFIRSLNMSASLEQPAGSAIDSNDTVYVSSGKDGSVSVLNTQGKLINTFGKRGAASESFVGIAVGNSGELLVCDDSNNGVVIY